MMARVTAVRVRPAIRRFLEAFYAAPTAAMPHVFDPWNARAGDDLPAAAVAGRRERLRRHLAAPAPRLLLVGEAPGYRGARISGTPFTSEALVLGGALPRLGSCPRRLSLRERPWRESSATVVWEALVQAGLAEQTLLWNAFPWHPFKPGMPLSNRPPTARERAAGLPLLRRLVDALPGTTVVAVGQVAAASLREAGIAAPVLRHPSRGGAQSFRAGLARLAG